MIDWEKLRDEKIPIEFRVGNPKLLGYITAVDKNSVWVAGDDTGTTSQRWYKGNVEVVRALGDREIPHKPEWEDVTNVCCLSADGALTHLGCQIGTANGEDIILTADAVYSYRLVQKCPGRYRIERKV